MSEFPQPTPQMNVSKIVTPGYHGYNVKFSPFIPNIIACAASENYGIAGKGCMYIVDVSDTNSLHIVKKFNWTEGIFDVAWGESNPNLLVTGCADGSIQIWDHLKHPVPLTAYNIHGKEVNAVDWNPRNTYPFILSASWDATVKLWDPFAGREVGAFLGHKDKVYAAAWSPFSPELFASTSADSTLAVWDVRTSSQPCNATPTQPAEMLTCDWCKMNPNVIATGGTDGSICGWDTRHWQTPIFQLRAHEYAVRRLKFSPFQQSRLASVSYDFTTKFWDWGQPQALQTFSLHTEFAYGIDFNPQRQGQTCDCAWDSYINVYEEAA